MPVGLKESANVFSVEIAWLRRGNFKGKGRGAITRHERHHVASLVALEVLASSSRPWAVREFVKQTSGALTSTAREGDKA